MFKLTLHTTAISVVFLLASCASPVAHITPSGKPEVSIEGIEADTVAAAIIDRMINKGYSITSSENRMLVFEKPSDSTTAAILFGSKYDSTPNARITYNINTYRNKTRVVASFYIVTNPGSSFERLTPANNNQETIRYQGMLNELKAELGGNADDGQGDQMSISGDLLDFANGRAELVTPGWVTAHGAAIAAGKSGQLTKGLHDSKQWEALAREILKNEYGDNLGWYYLGRAAEGMALCDAAALYYDNSKERSEKFVTRCLSAACYGIKLPEALEERFIAIEAMRAAGICSTPPN